MMARGLEDLGSERDMLERMKAAEMVIKDLVTDYPAVRNDLPTFQKFRRQCNVIQLHSTIMDVLIRGLWTPLQLVETVVWHKLPERYLVEFQRRCQDKKWKLKYTRSLYQLCKWVGRKVISKATIDAAEETLRSGMHQGENEEVFSFAQRVEDQVALASMNGRDFSTELSRAFVKGLVKTVRGVNFGHDVEHMLDHGRHKMDWCKHLPSAKERWKFWRVLRKRVEREYLALVPTLDTIHDDGYSSPRRSTSPFSRGRYSSESAQLTQERIVQACGIRDGRNNYRDSSRSPMREMDCEERRETQH
jgi:hypothetical protein